MIWIEPKYEGREAVKAIAGARQLGYEIGWGSPVPVDCVPVGSVAFCESVLGYSPTPDFAPEWLNSWLKRDLKVCRQSVATFDCFVKSAEKYKEWPPKIVKAGEPLPSGLLLISEIVEFTQEWRYYVSDGVVLATGWYDGHDDDESAPSLDVEWPKGWCGAVDFGRLASGEIALVESHHPYACGWYGDEHAAYVMWLVDGWEWTRNHKINP